MDTHKGRTIVIRIDRLLSNRGYCSRREVSILIKEGALREDGTLITKSDQKVDPDKVTIDDEPIDPGEGLSILLHKPTGYVCSHRDKGRLIYELLPERFSLRKPSLSSVGRLDKETSGLLVLTDDGDFNHRLTAPNKNVGKIYHVTLNNDLAGNEAALFASGNFCIAGEPEPLKPAHWSPTNPREGLLKIFEGRYHQVRRMFETIGLTVVKLHRTQIGSLTLQGLQEGSWRILTDSDKQLLFKPQE